MKPTIKEIAALAGVSRGTVDRALNDRGGVNPEVERLIKDIAQELDYKPNLMAKALASVHKNTSIGVIVNGGNNPFFDKVVQGIEQASSDIADFYVKVELVMLTGYDVQNQLDAIEKISKIGIGALVITAINDKRIADRLNSLSVDGIRIITLNSDVSGIKKLCFVGCDYLKSGQTAGELMGLIATPDMQVGIATGSNNMLGHNRRVEGFKSVVTKQFASKAIKIKGIVQTFDNDEKAYLEVKRLLSEHNEITALYCCAGGIDGALKAISEFVERDILVITVDDTPSVINHLKDGTIALTVCQQPFKQGYDAVKIAFTKLIEGKSPPRKHIYTENEVKTKYNI